MVVRSCFRLVPVCLDDLSLEPVLSCGLCYQGLVLLVDGNGYPARIRALAVNEVSVDRQHKDCGRNNQRPYKED
jgi:hypothetical protein